MPFKKIDQEFVLSDSSVNVYGIRLLTDGYKMDEFMKNPIGYYRHKKDDGVLLRWEDVRLDGDKVKGKPVINLDHPRGDRTVNEISEGFLNAASFGKLVIEDYKLEDNPEDKNDPIVVATKWYNKECSIVENPGNRNAMKVELCDADGNEINLSDITEAFKIKKSKINNMKKVELPITRALITLLNLGDEPSGEEVANRMKEVLEENVTLSDENKTLKDDIQKETKKLAEARIKTIIDKGLEDGKFTKETGDKLAAKFAGKPEDLEDVVDTMPKYIPLTDKLKEKSKKVADLEDKSWDELDRGGQLEFLKANAPDVYDAKLKELREKKK